jgi:hypothetical protein
VFGRDQVDVVVDRNQGADTISRAAPDYVSGRQHALGCGDRNITQQYASGTQHGQEISGRRQGKT